MCDRCNGNKKFPPRPCPPKFIYAEGPTGPRGLDGEPGISETIAVGNVSLVDSDNDAEIIDHKNGLNHIFDFVIPRGRDGKDGKEGPTGPMGPMGPSGKDGTSVTILGSYDSEEDLKKDHTTGSSGDSYLVGDDLYVWSSDGWKNVGRIRGPKGEKGDMGLAGPKGDIGPIGPTGPSGPSAPINTAYFITYNSGIPEEGYRVGVLERLPITREESDNSGQYELNTSDNTITFNEAGVYKLTFIVNAYVKKDNDYNDKEDVVAIGVKKVGEDIVYAGSSNWSYDNRVVQLTGQGMFVIADETDEKLEIVNMSQQSIYLKSPSIDSVSSHSYIVNPLLTIIIEYLDKV